MLRVRRRLEVLLAAGAVRVVPLLQRRTVLRVARAGGWLGYRVAWRARRIARANVRLAFGDALGDAETERIVRGAFETFALVMLDLFWFARDPVERIGRHVAFDESFRHYFDARPVIAAAAHFGNWEVMGQAAALAGHPCVSVAASLDNPRLDVMLAGWRSRTGQAIAFRDGAVRHLLKALREGGRVALVLDQNVRPAEGGVFVPFFGLPVAVSPAAAMLSGRTGAPVVMTFCLPDGQGGYRAAAEPLGRAADMGEDALTAAIMAAIEKQIRRRPECWLWMYRRWKYIPPGGDAARYPFYAHPARGAM